MQIGPYTIAPRVILAPMAGVTDKPFRQLCKQLGAGMAVSEMTISDPRFWQTRKSLHRMDHDSSRGDNCISRRPKPCRSGNAGCAPRLTPVSPASRTVSVMTSGSPAWKPQATFAEPMTASKG